MPDDLASEHPVSMQGVGRQDEQLRAKLLFMRQEVIPGDFALNHMGICVDDSNALLCDRHGAGALCVLGLRLIRWPKR